jgi:hypothetical protein
MILFGLPIDFDGGDKPEPGSDLIIHAQGTDLILQPFNEMHLSGRMNFKVSFPKGAEFESFRVETEIVWRDIYFWEDWKGYQYASKFVESLDGHYLKLKRLLCRLAGIEETPLQIRPRGVFV